MTSAPVVTVVAYSALHFNPNIADVPFRHSSAGNLAEAVYEAARISSEHIVYVDGGQPASWPKLNSVTHLISIERNFEKLVSFYEPKHTLLFAVNQEAGASRMKWLTPVIQKEVPLGSVFRVPEVVSRNPRVAHLADKILMVGDNRTLGTYLQADVNINNLHVVPYGAGGISKSSTESGNSILFIASSIGVRKGSDLIPQVLGVLKDRKVQDINVVLVGGPSNRYWQRQIEKWSEEFGSYFSYRGWIDSASEQYEALMRNAVCAVVPSREEGLVGTAVEAIRSGIPTFATVECGLGLRPSRFVLDPRNRMGWSDQIVNFAIGAASDSDRDLESRQSMTVSRFQSSNQIKSAIERFIDTQEISPEYWIWVGEVHVSVLRFEEAESVRWSEYAKLKSTELSPSPILDGIFLGIEYLENDNEISRVNLRYSPRVQQCLELIANNQEAEMLMGSVTPGRLLVAREESFIAGTLEFLYSIVEVDSSDVIAGRSPRRGRLRRSLTAFAAIWVPKQMSAVRRFTKIRNQD